MRVLITGASGFAGRWLARELARDKKLALYGISRSKPEAGALPKRLRFFRCDLNDGPALRRALRRIRPERIHHLAGQASVSQSWKDPASTARENVAAARTLLASLRALKLRPAVHVAGSAEVYGRQKRARIRETDRPKPRNPYALSKLEQEKLFSAYAEREGAPVVVTRAFNHGGPGQKERFALSDFARQIARIEKGGAAELRVGNLSAVRDFADVRDVVRAYRRAIETAEGSAVYNVATGRARTLESVVRSMARLSRVPVRVLRDPSRMRGVDLPRLVGDASKLRRETGWKPAIPLEKTLRDTLDYWRKRS